MINVIKYSKNTKNNKKEAGITLITLIITVVVMLMLAGVAISAVVDGDGLFSKMRQAVETYENATETEEKNITSLIDIIDEYMTRKYVDWSISPSGLVKAIDSDGNLYVSEEKINIRESIYTNTGIKLVKVDNIKANHFIIGYYDEYIMDNAGKIYIFNEASNTCELLANGKEFDLEQYYGGNIVYVLGKDGYIYNISENIVELNEEVKDIKFKAIKYNEGLSIDNKIYNLYYGTLTRGDYEVLDFDDYFFIDVNNDLYNKANPPKRISDGNIKFEKIFHFEDYYGDYVIAKNGYLYEVFAGNVYLMSI